MSADLFDYAARQNEPTWVLFERFTRQAIAAFKLMSVNNSLTGHEDELVSMMGSGGQV